MTPFSRPRFPLAALELVCLAACAASRPSPAGLAEAVRSCTVQADAGAIALRSVTIAVHEPFSLDSAPVPGNPGERLAMRQLYETLVRRDCNGRLQPAMASSWKADEHGEYWTFNLTSDSLRHTISQAEAVRGSWERRKNGGIWPWAGILDVEVVSPFQLRVRLATPTRELPLFFADPVLAVSDIRAPGRIPGETGIYRVGLLFLAQSGPMLRLWTLTPPGDSTRPVLRFESVLSQVDDRDILDAPDAPAFRAADLLMTDDSSTLAYVRARNDFRTVPLPWDRTYVLVSRDTLSGFSAKELDGFRGSLVPEVVRGELREAAPPFWWSSDSSCMLTGQLAASPQSRIVYPAGDVTARAVAERVAVLAGSPGRPRRVTPLAPGDLERALASGDAAGFIITVPREHPASCHGVPSWPGNLRVAPLLDSRLTLVVRRGVPSFVIDGDGAIRFMPHSQ
ncbi:MAG: hypothetical protein ABI613_05185 [Gemmatimonadota bacterium]